MKEDLKYLFNNMDGYKTFDELTDKDIKKIDKIDKYVYKNGIIAFKDLSTLFKTEGYIFTEDWFVLGKDMKIPLKGLHSMSHKSGDNYELTYSHAIRTMTLPKDEAHILISFTNYVRDLTKSGIEHYNHQDYELAVKDLKVGAYYGNINAVMYMATCYAFGAGIHKDIDKALENYEKAFPRVNTDAHTGDELIKIGDNYFNSTQYLAAYVLYKRADEKNHPVAPYYIGHLYHYGKGFDQNYNEAIKWYEKALSRDPKNQRVHYKLALIYKELKRYNAMEHHLSLSSKGDECITKAWMYYHGEHYMQNRAQAAQLFEIASRTNNKAFYGLALSLRDKKEKDDDAYFNALIKGYEAKDNRILTMLGEAYEEGIGCERDLKKAYEMYKESSVHYFDGLIALGRFYRDGIYVHTDYNEALNCFNQCIEAKHYKAYNEIAKLYFLQNESQKAIEALNQGLIEKDCASIISLAKCYIEGKYVSKNTHTAYQLLQKAIQNDHRNNAKIAFMNCVLDKEILLTFDQIKENFDHLVVYDYYDKVYNDTFNRYRDYYKKMVVDRYIVGQQFDEGDGYYQDAIYFYNDEKHYYFIDVKTYEIKKAREIITYNLKFDLEDRGEKLILGTKVLYRYEAGEIRKLCISYDF